MEKLVLLVFLFCSVLLEISAQRQRMFNTGWQRRNPCGMCSVGQRCIMTRIGAACVPGNRTPVGNMMSRSPFFRGRQSMNSNTNNNMFGRRNTAVGGSSSPFQRQMTNNMMTSVVVTDNNGRTFTVSVPFACTLSRDEGNCVGGYRRYFYDRFSGRCEEFTFSGCGGNMNNFATLSQCQQLCVIPNVA